MSETYYGAFYGFHTAPFHITPDRSLMFLTTMYEGALGAIEYGIKAGKGFIVVSGEVGVGKTTVLRACLDRLDPARTKIIYLFNPELTTAELYGSILDEFDPSLRVFISQSETLRMLLRQLLEAHQSGLQVVLAVDEAQNMPDQTLESLRILSNLETTKTKLVQIILVGQPELDTKLRQHSMRQLAQRIAVRARLKHLSFRQSCLYIQHRTQHAGQSRSLFTAPAQWYIALIARGIPRTINICCDNALINGYGHAAKRITLGIAREACNSLEYSMPHRRTVALALTAVVLLCGGLAGRGLLDHGSATSTLPAAAEVHSPLQPGSSNPEVEAPPPQSEAVGPPAPPPISESVPVSDAASSPVPAASDVVMVAKAGDTPGRFVRWLVRDGDSIYKACLRTYGACDDRALRAVRAANPQIRVDGLIHDGQTVLLPETIGQLHARPDLPRDPETRPHDGVAPR